MIINLSIESSVVSTHTAYVAVDEEQDKPIAGAIKTWDITAAMAEQEGRLSWRSGGKRGGGVGKKCKMKQVDFMAPARALAAPLSLSADLNTTRQKSSESRARRFKDARDVTFSVKLKPNATSDKHTALISLQHAEGNWQFNTALATVLAKPLPKLESSCPDPCKGSICEVWATILVLVFLETVCDSQKDEWELVAFKAEGWLQGQPLPSGVDMTTLKEAARKSM